MRKKLATVTAMVGGVCFLAAQAVMANTPMTTCPSIDMLKTFDGDYVETMPMSFSPLTTELKTVIMQKRTFEASTGLGTLVFVMSGVTIQEGEDEEHVAKALLGKMQVDAETPVMFRMLNDRLIPICSYSLPGEDVKALVFQAPEEAENDR